jgi:hypothetical protein
MTPTTLVGPDADINNAKVIKILQFLQSIDSDHNASNGITISDAFISGAESETTNLTTDDFNLTDLFTRLSVEEEHQVKIEDAKKHFQKTLYEIKKKNATGFAIIEGVYQDGNTILNITDKGVINSYKYDQLDYCIKAVVSGDKAYNLDGKTLTHDANKKEFTFVDGAGWKYDKKNDIISVFVGETTAGGSLTATANNLDVFLTTKKSTKFPTSADITKNSCTTIGVTKRFENIQGVYRDTTYNYEDDDDIQTAVRNTVTHINKDGNVTVYIYVINAEDEKACLEIATSSKYNYKLKDIVLSKLVYGTKVAGATLLEYFYKDDDGRASWLEENGNIKYVAYKESGEITNIKPKTFRGGGYALTLEKSTKYTEANITSSICK